MSAKSGPITSPLLRLDAFSLHQKCNPKNLVSSKIAVFSEILRKNVLKRGTVILRIEAPGFYQYK